MLDDKRSLSGWCFTGQTKTTHCNMEVRECMVFVHVCRPCRSRELHRPASSPIANPSAMKRCCLSLHAQAHT